MHSLRLIVIALALSATTTTFAESSSSPLRLATTTSTENSGLLDFLLPAFEKKFETKVHVIAVGSGKAIKLGENGDVDVILSHAPGLEERFISDGRGIDRRPVMYNDFVIVGPVADPAQIKKAQTAKEALRLIAASGSEFVSRGDRSGTHLKETALWKSAGIEPAGAWYLSAGLGMGRVLLMTGERQGYTLTDRGTFLSYKGKTDLAILFEGDPPLHNPYTIMAVNPARHSHANFGAASALIKWITGAEAQGMIRSYQVSGQTLFFPNADQPEPPNADQPEPPNADQP